MSRRPARAQDIDTLALSLPEVAESTAWGARSFAVRGKNFIIFRTPSPDALDEAGERLTDVVVFLVPTDDDKRALVLDGSTPFFSTDHFTRYRAVLLRLAHIGRLSADELAEVVTDAWAAKAPKRVAKAWFAEHGLTGP